jgi:hypothetical protein
MIAPFQTSVMPQHIHQVNEKTARFRAADY